MIGTIGEGNGKKSLPLAKPLKALTNTKDKPAK